MCILYKVPPGIMLNDHTFSRVHFLQLISWDTSQGVERIILGFYRRWRIGKEVFNRGEDGHVVLLLHG